MSFACSSVTRSFVLRATSTLALAALVGPAAIHAQESGARVPREDWMAYADVAQAGFDPAALEAARVTWEGLPSSAFLVVADGAVVADWGETQRRFMCHSVRKSFLSALYGIYWDRRAIELNKTLDDLGLDDEPDPLLETEKQARILDLLKARSGVFHPAAYAGRTDSRPRGSEGPGRYFAYNNWDFNTLAAILAQETGADVFEAFDSWLGQPLGMEDWRVSDGYYHYERDKSKYPAYPFRMSARDAARFGLLFARDGMWGDERILSEHWVRRSSALYSIDNDVMGYGLMWWVLLDPRLERYGAFAALGVGNQMILVIPKLDMVIVNRADTYEGEGTPTPALLDLVAMVLDARVGTPAAGPELAPIADRADPVATRTDESRLARYVGIWEVPPKPLGLPALTTVRISEAEGNLVGYSPFAGTFALYLQDDGTLREEDSYRRYYPVPDASGALAGIARAEWIVDAALISAAEGDPRRADELLSLVAGDPDPRLAVAGAVVTGLGGDPDEAARALEALSPEIDAARVEAEVNGIGYALLRSDRPDRALEVFDLNTRVFPDAFNTWDSRGEALVALGRDDEAIRSYERSLELNPQNANATEMIARIRENSGGPD